jgi:hypothetical protein
MAIVNHTVELNSVAAPYVSTHQHTSAYVSICPHTSAYVSIRAAVLGHIYTAYV